MTKTTILFTIAAFSFMFAACAGKGTAPADISFLDHVPSRPDLVNDYPLEPVSGKTAFEYLADEGIIAGWNLGNTLDAHNDGIAGETVWGNPTANQALMDGIKAAGFDIIRIPVTWMGFIGAAPDYRLSAIRLRRVAEVAEMARNAGLKVIINMHHDGATETFGKDHGWLMVGRASRNTEFFNRVTAQYARVWIQIATFFKNYGDWLIFESFNELHDGSWGHGVIDINQIILINRWNQLFVDAVRSTGGNNESRFLMVGAYCKDRSHTLSAGFSLPVDTVPDRIIVSFHYYDPHEFGIQGTRSAWGTPADKQRVENDFAPFKERFIDKGIPVIIGECGAVLQLYPNDPAREAQARESRAAYIPHVFATARKYGLIPIYWDNALTVGTGEKFGLVDRRTGQPNSPESAALLRSMINVVK